MGSGSRKKSAAPDQQRKREGQAKRTDFSGQSQSTFCLSDHLCHPFVKKEGAKCRRIAKLKVGVYISPAAFSAIRGSLPPLS